MESKLHAKLVIEYWHWWKGKQSGSDPLQFHYALITDVQYHVPLSWKDISNPLESSWRLRLPDPSALVSSNVPLKRYIPFLRDLFYMQEIRGRVSTVGSIAVYCLIIRLYWYLMANFQILANDHFLFFYLNLKQLYVFLFVLYVHKNSS